jgi:hypothetical protein
VTFPNGSTQEFKVDESGLYHCEVPVSDFRLTANVHVNAEQKKRAKMVKELHFLLNHPSDEKLIQLLNSGSLLNCSLTSRCPSLRQHQRPLRFMPCWKTPLAPITPFEFNSSRQTNADLVNIVDVQTRRVPYLVVIDDHSDYAFALRLLAIGFGKIFAVIKSWGHAPGTVRTDPEAVFKSVAEDINNQGYRMEHTAVGRHERKVERFARVLKERIRTVRHSLPYSLPMQLMRHLMQSIVSTHNMTPTYRSSPLTPQETMAGIKPDMKKDLRSPFGTFAVFHTPTKTTDEDPRGAVGIVLGRDFLALDYSAGIILSIINGFFLRSIARA